MDEWIIRSAPKRLHSDTSTSWASSASTSTPVLSVEEPTCSLSKYQRWISDSAFRCPTTNLMIFTLSSDGVLCLLCSKHNCHANSGSNRFEYSRDSARPSQRVRLSDHIKSARHADAVSKEMQQRNSVFHKKTVECARLKEQTVSERVFQVYWLMKEQIANRKLPSLQALTDKIGKNDLLRDFRHTSSSAVSEFILLISDHITSKILHDVTAAGMFAVMCDESTDIANHQQFITYVRYVKNAEIEVKFLDIRRMGAGGATGENLFGKLCEIFDDYDLQLNQLCGLASDGAPAMRGPNNSLCSRLLLRNPHCLCIHCCAHRLCLACVDSSSKPKLVTIQSFERYLLQVSFRYIRAYD